MNANDISMQLIPFVGANPGYRPSSGLIIMTIGYDLLRPLFRLLLFITRLLCVLVVYCCALLVCVFVIHCLCVNGTSPRQIPTYILRSPANKLPCILDNIIMMFIGLII